jgi:AcrR family transcriptional regulator
LILGAAEELFASRGYTGATTREIAERAGVAEPMIFRAFGSKEQLYRAAVVEPVVAFLDRFSADWDSDRAWNRPPEEVLTQFAGELYDAIREHRDLLLTVGSADELMDRVQPTIENLVHMSDTVKKSHGLHWDTPIAARAALCMVIGMALYGDRLYPEGMQAARDRTVAELSRMLIGAAGLLTQRREEARP